MLQEPMMEKLTAMRLIGMVDALKTQEQDPAARELSFRERLGLPMLVDLTKMNAPQLQAVQPVPARGQTLIGSSHCHHTRRTPESVFGYSGNRPPSPTGRRLGTLPRVAPLRRYRGNRKGSDGRSAATSTNRKIDSGLPFVGYAYKAEPSHSGAAQIY